MVPTEDADVRKQARKRLEKRRDFAAHLVAYVVINAMLVGIWAITGADIEREVNRGQGGAT